MTTMTLDEFVRNFESVMERLEHGGEEILLTRGERPVARLVPEAQEKRHMNALEAFADLQGILTDEEGEALLKAMEGFDRPLFGRDA